MVRTLLVVDWTAWVPHKQIQIIPERESKANIVTYSYTIKNVLLKIVKEKEMTLRPTVDQAQDSQSIFDTATVP